LTTRFSKILGFSVLLGITVGCSAVRNLPEDGILLRKNSVTVDDQVAVDSVANIVQPNPNNRFLGIPFGLLLYQSAKDSTDVAFDNWLAKKPGRKKRMNAIWSEKQVKKMKAYKSGFQAWKRKTGEAPVLSDSVSTAINAQKLKAFFSNEGYFNAVVKTATASRNRNATVNYKVRPNTPYFIDSIQANIQSPVLDSIYMANKAKSKLKQGERFRTTAFEQERNRLSALFRNAGVYPFQLNSIDFSVGVDSTGIDYRLPVQLNIRNYIENQEGNPVPKEYKISKMNTVAVLLGKAGNTGNEAYDSIGVFEGMTIFSQGKMKYSSKLLRESIDFKTNEPYSDTSRSTTLKQLNRLQSFDYPTIRYQYANEDETLLDASIFLMPKKRYSLDFALDVTQSNILKRGIAFSSGLSVLNVFKGAETLELGARGSFGRSADVAISEYGFDIQLRAPQFLLPFSNKINKQKLAPLTILRVGVGSQENIGLDKQSLTGSIQYQWNPRENRRWTFSLMDVEFVNNKNKANYFGVYTNAYGELNQIAGNTNTNPTYLLNDRLIIPQGTDSFIVDVLGGSTSIFSGDPSYQMVQRIEERRRRLTQNNLIISSGINFFSSSKRGIFDRAFTQFRANLSWSGNLLESLAKSFDWKQENGQYLLFEVPFSQFIKLETDFVKHWSVSENQVVAIRAFAGAAIPYGNADNIPFNRSFFGGGAYDNRAWEVYRLGPGSSDTGNEFNEANLKMSFNVEYRFDLLSAFKGALFVDAGNIWNVADNVDESARRFDGFRDLDELAVGTGFGLRYDFGLFLLRLDMGFKTHNPVLPKGSRWNWNYELKNANPTLGINYPF
jgi:outer membrane protein assembly factor BamA